MFVCLFVFKSTKDWDISQKIIYLSVVNEALSVNPSSRETRQVCNPSTWKVEAEEPGQGHHRGLYSDFEASL